jgi:hypothetical protein
MAQAHRVACVVTCLATATTAVRARAQDGELEPAKALPCRPTIACTSDVVPEGHAELELGYNARRGSNVVQGAGSFLAKDSVLDWLQLQGGTSSFLTTAPGAATQGVDGFSGGLKLRLAPQTEAWPGFALSGHLTLPTLTLPTALQRTRDASFWFYASKDVGRFHADFNAALTLFEVGERTAPQGLSALALSGDVGRGFGLMTEVYAMSGDERIAPRDGGWLNALSFSPAEEWVFDLGGDIGFYSATRAFTLFAGFTVVPYRLARRASPSLLESRSVARGAHP